LPQRGRIHFRAAGSAGALCPLELYVVGDGDGLPAGVWHFDPIAYCLTRVAAASPQQGPYLVITGIPARSGWKYADAAYRHLWWDCGTLLAQLMIVAHASGLPAWIQLEFADDAVAALVGADRVHELPLAIVPLGKGPLCPENPVAAGQAPETGWLGANVVEYPLVTAAHRAGEVTAGQREGRSRNCAGRPVTGDHAPASRPAAELRAHAPATAPGASELLETLILRRGSTRRFDPSGPIPAAALEWALMAGLAPVPWDVGPSLLQHHVLAHQVPDLPCPGLYRWTGRRLAAASPHLAQPRQAARRLCADIGLAQDAACVAVHCADLREVMNRLGERGYRAAMLEAGFAHGRFLLALFALGYGGTALMTSEAPAELGTLGDALLATAAGVSAYRSKAGGAPLAPVRLTQLR
jgi:SagB-type dehydrogenase family enzyme